MKDLVELDITLPQARLAELIADPQNAPEWMDDVERIEALSGTPGEPGSIYRLVPKRGKLVFVATVLARDLPAESRLVLDAPGVSVSVTGTFRRLSDRESRLTSEETFVFNGTCGKIAGVFARASIRRAHRRAMESFKRFAEARR